MTRLGRQDGPVLTVDLSDRTIESWSELWDALGSSCGLPPWFGRNLDAWWDTIQTGGIADFLDLHSYLVVRVRAAGLFDPHGGGEPFLATTNASDYAEAQALAP
jgi:hypothetical protein